MKKIIKFKNESGQALVEFALILPILLLLAGPVIDLGRAIQMKSKLQNISSDIVKVAVMEKNYSYQGGTMRLTEQKIAGTGRERELMAMRQEALKKGDNRIVEHVDAEIERIKSDREYYLQQISHDPDLMKSHALQTYEEGKGSLKNLLLEEYSISSGIDSSKLKIDYGEGYESTGLKSYKHRMNFPKFKSEENTSNDQEGQNNDEYDEYGYNKYGYDENGNYIYPNEGKTLSDDKATVANMRNEEKQKLDRKRENYILEGTKNSINTTYYREIPIEISYEMENITFMGKKLFGDKRILKESAWGIVYRGGDGRDVTD